MIASLLRPRVVRFLLVGGAVLLLLTLLQLSSLSAFLSSSSFSSHSQLSAEYSRVVSQLRADLSTFSPQHSITWLLAVMHELPSEVEVDNVKAALRVLRAAGVAESRIVVMERRARGGESERSVSLSAALGVRVTSLRRGSSVSSLLQYSEMLAAVFASSAYGEPTTSSSLCALIPSHVRVAADLPGFFFHAARLLKVDSTLLASSASSPLGALSLSDSWLPDELAASPNAASFLRSSMVESQLTWSLTETDTALLLTSAAFAAVSASLRSESSATSSLPVALSSVSSGRSFVSPVVSRAVSLLPSPSVRASERMSSVDVAQSAVAWPDLSRLSSIGYGYWLASLLPSCTLLLAADDVMDRRGECVVLVVPANSSSDAEWHLWLSNWLGAYAAVSKERRQEAAGEWRGVVVLRYLTNLVLLVAPYSPFFSFLAPPSAARGQSPLLESVGCYRHSDAQLDLPHVMSFLSARSLTPHRCLSACVHRGYQYAGIAVTEDGAHCRCGTAFTRSLSLGASSCPNRCSPSASLPRVPSSSSPLSDACGGASAVSLYKDSHDMHVRYQQGSPSATFVRGREGESCVAACHRSGAGECKEALFPLLTCGTLRSLGFKAGDCIDAARLTDEASVRALHVVAAPYVRTDGAVLGAGRWYDCQAVPLPETGRACACASRGMTVV